MRKLTRSIGAAVVLGAAISCAAAVKEPGYSSSKPLYAKFVLTKDGSKVLTVVFDESQGTAKGYDTIYADLNFNDDLTDDKPIKGKKGNVERQGPGNMYCSFPMIGVNVPYNEKAKGVERPWQLRFYFNQCQRSRFFGLIPAETRRGFSVNAVLRLRDESGEWQYFLGDVLNPAENLPAASPVTFSRRVSLQVKAKPDPRKRGNTGIAVYTMAGTDRFVCFKGNKPATGRVQITNQEGKTVHSKDVSLDKLVFG